MDPRQEFLLEMYKQLCTAISRHILIVWQSLGVLLGAFAVFTLVEKKVITLDFAVTLIVILCGWQWAHLLDASHWFNRNQAIVGNIERQFLTSSDLKEIHWYFARHRLQNRMIMHFQIQIALSLSIMTIVLLFHFSQRVVPGFSESLSAFEWQRALPYMATVVIAIYVRAVKRNRDHSYKDFITKSPGIDVLNPVDDSEIPSDISSPNDG